jgi:hypothetical protein
MTTPPDPAVIAALQNEWRGYRTMAGTQRLENRPREAATYEAQAKAVKRCIDVLEGREKPWRLRL